MGIRRIITIIHLAREADRAERSGKDAIYVPKWLMPEVRAMLYRRQVERAAERWRRKVADVSLEDWQKATIRDTKRGD